MLAYFLMVIASINSTDCEFVLPCIFSKARDFQTVFHVSFNPTVNLDGMQQRYITLCQWNLINHTFTLIEALKCMGFIKSWGHWPCLSSCYTPREVLRAVSSWFTTDSVSVLCEVCIWPQWQTSKDDQGLLKGECVAWQKFI